MFKSWKANRAVKSGVMQAGDLAHQLECQIETETRNRIVSLAATASALEPGWQDRLESNAAFIIEAANIRHAIRGVRQSGIVPEPARLRLQASSLFLKDCHQLLTSDPDGNEVLHLVSGTISDDGVRVMSRIVHVPMEEASPAYVRADAAATHKKIIELVERDGHALHAMFHSHIMHGAESTRPSGIDIANQERFCAIGWDDVIGGIFSLDGYVRLFSTAHDFSFSLYGLGAHIVTDHPRQKIIKLKE